MYNPTEPRDPRGRWTGGGGGGRDPASILYPNLAPQREDVAYNGVYHDQVVEWLMDVFQSFGIPAVKNVPIATIDGRSTAIVDIISFPKNGPPNFIEVKTGNTPSFTNNQMAVHPMASVGGHVISATDKLAPFGIPRGAPLPAANVWSAYAVPGEELNVRPEYKAMR